MRRSAGIRAASVVCAVSVGLGLATLAPAASADSEATVAWRPGAAPSDTGFWSDQCSTDAHQGVHRRLADDDAGVAASRTFVAGPDSGDVAWRYSPAPGTEAGPALRLRDPGTVTSVTVQARSAGSAAVDGRLLAFYRAPGADADDYFVGEAPLTVRATGWDRVDADGSMTWYHHEDPLIPLSFLPEWSTVRRVDSIATFAASRSFHGGSLLVSYQFGCTGQPFDIDHLRVVGTGGTTDYDLTNQATSSTMSAGTDTVRAGDEVTLTGTVTGAATGPVTSGRMALQARPYGAKGYKRVAAVSVRNGSLSVRPSGTTTYRWRFRGTLGAAPSHSAPVTVRVRTWVGAHVKHATVTRGRKFTLAGKAVPAHKGARVRVLRRTPHSKWKVIGHTRIGRHGHYRFSGTARPAGRVYLRARVAGADGDLAGHSRRVRLQVKARTTVRAHLAEDRVREGDTLVVRGQARPRVNDRRVRLQRRLAGHWRTIATASTNRHGRFRLARVADSTGTWRLRVLVAGSGRTRPGRSPVLTLDVRPRPAPPAPPAPPSPPPSGGGGTGIGGGSGGGTGGGTGIG